MALQTETERTFAARVHVTSEGTRHLRVCPSWYADDTMREALRRVGSPARWVESTLEWDYPLTPAAVASLAKVAEDYGAEIQWDADLATYGQSLIEQAKFEEDVRIEIQRVIDNPEMQLAPLLSSDPTPPMRHQVIGSHWAARSTGLYLAWDPGLGKTRAAVDAIGACYQVGQIPIMHQFWIPRQVKFRPAIRDEAGVVMQPEKWEVTTRERWGVAGGVLVICPKSVLGSWVNECARWQMLVALPIIGEPKTKRGRSGTVAHVHVCAYGSLHHVVDNVYDTVIVDEIHRCSNRTRQMALTLSLSLKARKRLVLSGTPVTNSPESVFYQMLICDHGRALGASKQAFLDQYFKSESTPGSNRPKYVPVKGADQEIARRMASCTYFLRKNEAIDLPPKTHVVRTVEMTKDQKAYYDALHKEAVMYVQDGIVTVELVVQKIAKLRQVCQGVVKDDDGNWRTFSNAKIIEVMSMLTGSLWGQKTVVFCNYVYEMDLMEQHLRQAGIGYVRLGGNSGSDRRRQQIFDAWNRDSRVTVFLIQIQISEGYTITAGECEVPCYQAIYLGITYSFVEWTQSQNRIHRIGQRYPCTYYYILTEGGIDSNIYRLLQEKAEHSDAVYTEGREYFRRMLLEKEP